MCPRAWAHTHVNLSDVHCTTGAKNILVGKLCEKLGAAVSVVSRHQSERSNRASRSLTIPASFQFLKTLVVESAYWPDPSGYALSQFRMIFGFPGSGGFPQDFTPPANLDLALGQLCQERTSRTFADQFVDAGNHVNRKGYVRRSAQILGHTPNVTQPTRCCAAEGRSRRCSEIETVGGCLETATIPRRDSAIKRGTSASV